MGRVKRLMPTKAVGPQCPECGSTHSSSLQRGWAEPNDDYIRRRECAECGVRFVTVEVVVPTDETTFYRLDYRGREWRRENYRVKYSKTRRRLPVQHSDFLLVSVKVKPNPKLERNICKRGHPFTPENTYVNPASGSRTCVLCRQIRQHHYYLLRKQEKAA